MPGPALRFPYFANTTPELRVVNGSDTVIEDEIPVTFGTNAESVAVSDALTDAPAADGLCSVEVMVDGAVTWTLWVYLKTSDTSGVLALEESPTQALLARGVLTVPASVAGAVGSVVGDVGGKVIGGGAATITGTGARVVDASGNNVAPSATALSTTQWTNTRAGYLDKLNTIAGSDGVTLATTQALYAPAKAGDEMDLVDAPNATAVATIQSGLSTVTTAQVNAEVDTALSDVGLTTTITGRIDATVSSRLASEGYTAPDNTGIAAIQLQTDKFVFTTAGQVDATAVTVSDKSGYALLQAFPANFAALGINSSGHVLQVALVDVTTTNSDMRGTDNALLASGYTAPANGDITAIKAKTDQLAFTVSNRVDATSDKTGFKLASDGLEQIVPQEPEEVPIWETTTITGWVGWLGALSRNKITQTGTTQTLRNDADSADIATAGTEDDGTTFTREEFE